MLFIITRDWLEGQLRKLIVIPRNYDRCVMESPELSEACWRDKAAVGLEKHRLILIMGWVIRHVVTRKGFI